MAQSDPQIVEVAGKRLRASSLAKVFFPEDEITKTEVLEYYFEWAQLILPHLTKRPVTIKAYPHGIAGRPYYRRHVPASAPEWLARSQDGEETPVIIDEADLMWVVNQDSIELHPWLSRIEHQNHPDQTIFDLDPGPQVSIERLCEAALLVRDALDGLGMIGWPKTSGSKGFHILVGIEPRYEFDEVRAWTTAVATGLASHRPDLFTTGYSKRDRASRVLVDFNQVGYGRTMASMYSVRPLPGAPVSAPVKLSPIQSELSLAYRK